MTHNFGFPLLAALGVALTACAPQPAVHNQDSDPSASEKPVAAAAGATAMALDTEGLRLVNGKTGSTRLLAFGTDRVTIEAAIAAQLGPPDGRSLNEECGAGPMDFSNFDDFAANFQDDRFAGWYLRGGQNDWVLTTMSGVGVGTTASEMAESLAFEIYDDSTIGTEFHAGGLSGLLESDAPDARITDLWAGANCIFR